MNEDPLAGNIPSEKLIAYRYLQSLYNMAKVAPPVVANPLDVTNIDHFLRSYETATCQICGRWYIATLGWCRLHHTPLERRSQEQFMKIALEWESFRSSLGKASHIKTFTRIIAIKLHYLQHFPEER